MDNFKAIYRILSTLEKAMDLTEFDTTPIGYKALGVSKERWSRYIEMLIDEGYIKGVKISQYINGEKLIDIDSIINPPSLNWLGGYFRYVR